ncbi:MAG: V-type ATPase subunit [Thermoplasmata archaeon]|nr:V-type ATPase subunit [Thermoplasmata archaeon]
MSGSPYASSLGRLKVQFPSFLTRDALLALAAAPEVGEVTKLLEPTIYGNDIIQNASLYQGAPLLEVAVNRTLVRRNRLSLESTPFAGKAVVSAYLRRWDIENIELILSAKAQGRPVTEAEAFLVSSREIPAGIFAGTMTLDDFRMLLQQPTLEAIANALVRFGYGSVLLPLLEVYERSHDIFPLLTALDREYYRNLSESSRFFQGDEWTVRNVIQSEIDVRNVLLLLKGKDGALAAEEIAARFVEGGTISKASGLDLYSARTLAELITNLEPKFPSLPEGNPGYAENRSLTGYEVALSSERAVRELKRLRTYPLSLSVIFTYLIHSELERIDLRRVIYGKLYGVPAEKIQSQLVIARLT